MLVGVDVGGTTTDAVLVKGRKVIRAACLPTDHGDLISCIFGTLDHLVRDVKTDALQRVVLSTTLNTNMIAEGKADPVALVLIPGPGINPADYHLGEEAFILGGAVDFRGREIKSLTEAEAEAAASRAAAMGFCRAAIVGKFSHRNPSQELEVQEIFSRRLSQRQIELGHRVSGQLNFPRRAATTMLTAASKDGHRDFVDQMTQR
jgi:N-methylhydantoinase A